MRLIDADALAKFIDYGHLNSPDAKVYSENDIREMIDMMPTIDKKFDVVRCKDCKFYQPFDLHRKYDCTRGLLGVMENDFCSFGKKERASDDDRKGN